MKQLFNLVVISLILISCNNTEVIQIQKSSVEFTKSEIDPEKYVEDNTYIKYGDTITVDGIKYYVRQETKEYISFNCNIKPTRKQAILFFKKVYKRVYQNNDIRVFPEEAEDYLGNEWYSLIGRIFSERLSLAEDVSFEMSEESLSKEDLSYLSFRILGIGLDESKESTFEILRKQGLTLKQGIYPGRYEIANPSILGVKFPSCSILLHPGKEDRCTHIAVEKKYFSKDDAYKDYKVICAELKKEISNIEPSINYEDIKVESASQYVVSTRYLDDDNKILNVYVSYYHNNNVFNLENRNYWKLSISYGFHR